MLGVLHNRGYLRHKVGNHWAPGATDPSAAQPPREKKHYVRNKPRLKPGLAQDWTRSKGERRGSGEGTAAPPSCLSLPRWKRLECTFRHATEQQWVSVLRRWGKDCLPSGRTATVGQKSDYTGTMTSLFPVHITCRTLRGWKAHFIFKKRFTGIKHHSLCPEPSGATRVLSVGPLPQ